MEPCAHCHRRAAPGQSFCSAQCRNHARAYVGEFRAHQRVCYAASDPGMLAIAKSYERALAAEHAATH